MEILRNAKASWGGSCTQGLHRWPGGRAAKASVSPERQTAGETVQDPLEGTGGGPATSTAVSKVDEEARRLGGFSMNVAWTIPLKR